VSARGKLESEQGRARPNAQAAALLVRRYPDTLAWLGALGELWCDLYKTKSSTTGDTGLHRVNLSVSYKLKLR